MASPTNYKSSRAFNAFFSSLSSGIVRVIPFPDFEWSEFQDLISYLVVYDSNIAFDGAYNPITNELRVNMLSIENCTWEGLLDTVGHEMRHAWQWQSGDKAMIRSLKNYVFPDESIEGYWNQLCEVDARNGAAAFVETVVEIIQGWAA